MFILKHTIIWSYTSLPPLVLLLLLVLRARQKLLGELVPLEEEHFGMNNSMKSSSIVMLSYHLYSSAYELDYSFHVIIMIYELAYSLCVIILSCSTSCFHVIIIHK